MRFPQILAEVLGQDRGATRKSPRRRARRRTHYGDPADGQGPDSATCSKGGQRLQIYVKKDAVGDQGFELYKLLDLGDHIGVSGYLFRTRTGELSIHVEEITFLSKDLLPLPEKWHGLTDVELRYRQRYVDFGGESGSARGFF